MCVMKEVLDLEENNHYCMKIGFGKLYWHFKPCFYFLQNQEIEHLFCLNNSHEPSRFAVRGLDEGGQSVPFANRAQSSGMQDITRCCQTCTGTRLIQEQRSRRTERQTLDDATDHR